MTDEGDKGLDKVDGLGLHEEMFYVKSVKYTDTEQITIIVRAGKEFETRVKLPTKKLKRT